jgi:uncharacterized membrane protein YedE/YeeE
MTTISTTADAFRPTSTAAGRPRIDLPAFGVAALLITLGTIYVGQAVDRRQAALFVVGTLAGVVLYHAAFGFTSAWRVFISDRRGAGLRAQMLMLALTCVVFFPLLASGITVAGQPLRGSLAPVSLSVVLGAFLFGIGMQLGGGCASGTLYTAGGGNTRMLVTLASFIVGSAVATSHVHWWQAAPGFAPVSLIESIGTWLALAIQLAVFGIVAAATLWLERRRHGLMPASVPARRGVARVLQGPWPLVAGAIGLAAVNIATLALAGRPWGVTSALALWGSKIALAAGIDVTAWPYWATPARTAELKASVVNDVTSVMNFGIMLGALAGAGLAGRFAPVWRIPFRSLVAAVVGGLLLGYGARLAYGCNIGAYFSGIASASLHGWVWFAAAFTGNVFGTRLRPWFGLTVERGSAPRSKPL